MKNSAFIFALVMTTLSVANASSSDLNSRLAVSTAVFNARLAVTDFYTHMMASKLPEYGLLRTQIGASLRDEEFKVSEPVISAQDIGGFEDGIKSAEVVIHGYRTRGGNENEIFTATLKCESQTFTYARHSKTRRTHCIVISAIPSGPR